MYLGRPIWRLKARCIRTQYLRPICTGKNSCGQVPSNRSLLKVLSKVKDAKVYEDNGKGRPGDTQRAALSQSPLTDLEFNAARFGHKQAKTQQQENLSFQARLGKNPYARALAVAPRYCLLTGKRLPHYFLLRFGLTQHPRTRECWHMPTIGTEILTRDQSSEPRSSHQNSDIASNIQKEEQDTSSGQVPARTLTGTYFISNYQALQYVSSLAESRYHSMFPQRWKENQMTKAKHIIWRKDMADFVLGLLRREIVQWLESLSDRANLYMAQCDTWQNIQDQRSVAAVLTLTAKSVDDFADLGHRPTMEGSQRDWKYMQYRGTRIPLYCGKTMLGSDCLSHLKERNESVYGGEFAVIRKKNMTTNLQMSLWKLAWYVS